MISTKVALITGGSSGLGLAMAHQLADQGHAVILIARNATRLNEAVSEIQKKGNKVFAFPGDITREEDLQNIAKQLQSQFKTIDFLILNAGVVHVKTVSEYSGAEEMKQDLEIDLWGTILSAKIFLPFLRSGSKILFISSAFGLLGGAGYSIYCAAKAGVVNFAESLRRELLRKKISVYVACPPDIDTPQFRRELERAPDWLKQGGKRGVVLSAETAARRILRKCRGGRFLILINFDMYLLSALSRILPRCWKDRILDHLLPRP